MIQRIQSIFYFLGAGSIAGVFGLPFYSAKVNNSTMFSDLLFNVYDHIALVIVSALTILLSLVTIFLFNNRKLQIRLGSLGILLSIILFIVVGYLLFQELSGELDFANMRFGIAFPVLAAIFIGLGNMFVKKDENLVKSMDRLR